jgi:hypothetical protein
LQGCDYRKHDKYSGDEHGYKEFGRDSSTRFACRDREKTSRFETSLDIAEGASAQGGGAETFLRNF